MTLIALHDLESNGLLKGRWEKGAWSPPMDKVHGIAIKFSDGRKLQAALEPIGPHWAVEGWEQCTIPDALRALEEADIRVAHNGDDFDERAIRKIYPWFNPKQGSSTIDTLILSKLCYPDIGRQGPNNRKILPKYRRAHSLGAWGQRLGNAKGEYKGGWLTWSPDMQFYMLQDVEVLDDLFRWLMSEGVRQPAAASVLEHDFARVMRRQEDRGFAFNMDKALSLQAKLQALEEQLETQLIQSFGQWWESGTRANNKAGKYDFPEPDEEEDDDDPAELTARYVAWQQSLTWNDVVVPTVSRRVKLRDFPDVEYKRFSDKTGKELKPYVGPPTCDYTFGHAYTPVKLVEFNPGSRAHVTRMLVQRYGWKPVKFTKNKEKPIPIVDDDILRSLPYPEAPLLANYYLTMKRLGALSNGKKAWLKVVQETKAVNGEPLYRVHGRVNTIGTTTYRPSFSDPNMGQVAKNTAATLEAPQYPELWGDKCRDLFEAASPYALVGHDGSSLELCMLGHYVYRFDGGAYAKSVAEGRKEDATDPHSWMRDAIIGTNLIGEGDRGRDHSKTTMYAYLYGAGDEKIGSIILPKGTKKEKVDIGAEIKFKLITKFTALAQLQKLIETTVEDKKSLPGLDGRILRVRKAHAALNTLLQSAGAIVMKKSLVLLDAALQANGLIPGQHYEFVANVYDEAQAEVLPECVELYKKLAVQSVPEAGIALKMRCALSADASVGHSWRDTH